MPKSSFTHASDATSSESKPSTSSGRLQTYIRLLSYVRPYWGLLGLVVIGYGINSATEIGLAKAIEFITDAINNGEQHKLDLFPLYIIILFIVRGAGTFLGNYFLAKVSLTMIYHLRVEMFEKMLRLPSHFYLQNPAGTLSSKLIFDVEQITAASTKSFKILIQDGLTVLGLIGFLFYQNWRLSLILFLVLPPILWLVRQASNRYLKLSQGVQKSMSEVSHVATEVMNGYQVVRNYGGQKYEIARLDRAAFKNLKQAMKIEMITSINTPVVQLLMASAIAMVMWLGLRPSVIANTTAGEFVAYLGAMIFLSKPIRSLTNINQRLQTGIAAGQSIFALLDEDEEQDSVTTHPPIQGNIRFERVSVEYPDGTKALDNFTLDIQAGQTVALVGRSGAGKTTLVNLLTRILHPSTGNIYIDGVAIDDYGLSELRAQIAMVNQQVTLFDDTVRHNIAYGELAELSEAAVIAAAKGAFAHDFIMQIPNKYDSHIGAEGLQLSGGQRQRLSIARALLKDAPILILDEATSALDNESEHYIQQALDNVMSNRTTLVIAHRLTTTEAADKIVVMDKGRIVESGTHHELMAQAGHYAQMYDRDFKNND